MLHHIDVIRRILIFLRSWYDVILRLFSLCLRVQWVIMTSIRTMLCVTKLYNIVLRLIILTSRVRCFVNTISRLRTVWWTLLYISVITNNTWLLKTLVINIPIERLYITSYQWSLETMSPLCTVPMDIFLCLTYFNCDLSHSNSVPVRHFKRPLTRAFCYRR